MATIAENLQILVDNKADIKEAIERVIAEDSITLRMSAWADLLNAYEDELQDATSNTAFPFRFPITFKPEMVLSKYFPFSLPIVFTPLPVRQSVEVTTTTSTTRLFGNTAYWNNTYLNAIKTMTIDGSVVTKNRDYKFSTIGEHYVEYELVDPEVIPTYWFRDTVTTMHVILSEGIKSIGSWDVIGATHATIEFPNSCTSIGSCQGVYHPILGTGTISVGNQGFRNCTYITCKSLTPPTLVQWNHFANNVAIYVPAEAVDTYKRATGWTAVASIIQAIPE